MVPRNIAGADPPVATRPGVPADQGSPGDSIPVGRILAGRLRVLDRLGSTPEGPLYRAEYLSGVEVALVVLCPEGVGGGPSPRERLGRATRIQHPNVAAVYELGEMDDGSVYAVLEQLVGEPLSNLLAAGQVFALQEALDLALQAAAGLEAAHRAGFVHGNLSPHSILVTPEAHGQSQVKLIGFTLDPAFWEREAKAPIPEAASAGYASPERLVGQPPDERSDVFSLGAVLHHLLTGTPPDQGQVDGSVPKVARAVLATAMAAASARRFQTISELHEALDRLASGGAVPKRAKMHRALLIGGVAASLALVTGGVWLLAGSNWRATSEKRPVPVATTRDLGRVEPRAPTTREAPRAPAPARSPAPAPPAPRQDPQRSRESPADSGRSPAGPSANPAPRTTRPATRTARPAPTALADAETDRSIDKGIVATPPPEEPPRLPADSTLGDPPRPRSTDAPAPVAVEKLENRPREERPETLEALGYVGEPAPSSVPTPPPDSTPAPEARPAGAIAPVRTTEDPRPRAELERDQGLRQAIGDVVRLGVVKEVAEVRPGFLLVSLTPAGMDVPSAMYNLQRLYLAYSAATEYRDEVALELRHGRDLYGWFTRKGLKQAS